MANLLEVLPEPKLVTRSAIRRVAREIAERFQPELILLFGSYAYGQPRPDSDVDLLVVMPAWNERSRGHRIASTVQAPFRLDIHVRTPKHFKEQLEEGEWFLCEIVARGQVLYGRPPPCAWWARAWFHRGHAIQNSANGVELGDAMKKSTAEWVRKAEMDWTAAALLRTSRLYDIACFCCQQSAEKYFKALLEEWGLPIPRTHDLLDLLGRLVPHDGTLQSLRSGLDRLTEFAVEIRYPPKRATLKNVTSAQRCAGRIRDLVRQRLGLPAEPKKPRRRP